MKNQIIAKRYSRALFSLAVEGNAIEQFGMELDGFIQVLKAYPDFENMLRNPLYPEAVKKSLFQKVSAQLGMTPIVSSFLNLLVEKKRIQHLPEITDYYHMLMDEHSNISRAKVKAAVKLDAAEIEKIGSALEKRIGRKIVVEFEQDPSLLGGVFAQIGDLVLDGSVKRQLLTFKESLKRGAVG
ncbi:MAG: ATP synthase F1 subunit delta [Syntrophobacteraceae bacterium]|nr:ATP synthase F1 subunit delta [Syntrophobacteraceae bacterium]